MSSKLNTLLFDKGILVVVVVVVVVVVTRVEFSTLARVLGPLLLGGTVVEMLAVMFRANTELPNSPKATRANRVVGFRVGTCVSRLLVCFIISASKSEAQRHSTNQTGYV